MCGWFLCLVKRGCWSRWNLSYRQLRAAFQVLGVVPGWSLTAASTFILWAIYPALPSSCWCLVVTRPERLWRCCCWFPGCLRARPGAEQCRDTACASTSHRQQLLPSGGTLTFILLLKNCRGGRLWEHFSRRQLLEEAVFYWVMWLYCFWVFLRIVYFLPLCVYYIKWVMLPVLFWMHCHLVLLFLIDTLYLEEKSMLRTFDSMKF